MKICSVGQEREDPKGKKERRRTPPVTQEGEIRRTTETEHKGRGAMSEKKDQTDYFREKGVSALLIVLAYGYGVGGRGCEKRTGTCEKVQPF